VVDGANDESASPQAFVDTQPSPGEAPEGGEAQGERQAGRRRNRRGGRGGRDRDEAGTDNGQAVAPAVDDANAGDAPQAVDAEQTSDDIAPRADAGEAGDGRRRGRGRDRNRRERSPEGVTQDGDAAAAEGAVEAPVAAAEATPVATVAEAVPAVPAEEVVAAAPVTDDTPTPAVAAPVVPVAAVPVAAPAEPVVAPAPAAPAAAAPIVVAPFVLPTDSLQAVAEAAGLQWVNSDAEKIRAVQEAMAATPAPVHVPRERKPTAVVDEGPLVLVETRKDLSQIKLPFETAQGSQPPV